MNNNKNNSEKKMLPVSNGLNGAKRLRKGLLAGIFVLLLIVGVSGLQAQLCMSTSFYNNLSWTWSYAGPCSSTYNCLSYSLGITSSWTWPWGYSNPTDSQVTSYLSGRGYYTTGDSAKIISYGTSSSSIGHFSKVTGSSSCRAKCGGLNLLNHYSWNPYYSSSSYGSKRRVYYTRTPSMSVNISGPVKGNNSGTYTWCANVSNGTASSYFWQYRYSTSESYRTWGSTQCMSAHLPLDRDLLLKVTVTDAAGNQATDTFFTMNLDTFKPSIIRPNYDSMESIAGDVSYILSAAASKNLVGPNPYDYINNERFRAIVAKGPKALISIRQMILESNENGLENYILAIAAEEIARVNLKDTSFKWATGQEFATQWDSFMRKLPTLVEEIVTSNLPQANKHKALLKLGIPAVPYILTEIERGEKGFDKVLKALLKGAPGMIERTEGESLESWKKNNKDTISFLIEMADAYRNQ